MLNKFLILLSLFLLLGLTVDAQVFLGKGVSSATYRKVSHDSVRAGMKRGRGTVRKKVKKPGVKTRKAVVDSVRMSPKKHYLGERVIMQGDSGRDVRAVAQILVNKLYIDEASLVYTMDGGVRYEGELVRAVKHFQEFNGFYPDGIIGQAVIKALRKRKD